MKAEALETTNVLLSPLMITTYSPASKPGIVKEPVPLTIDAMKLAPLTLTINVSSMAFE